MTDLPYPPEEHIEGHVSFMDTALPDMLMLVQDRVIAAEEDTERSTEQALRWDEGVVAMEWTLSRLPHASAVAVPVMVVMKMLGDITTYANVNLKAEWIGVALEEVGR